LQQLLKRIDFNVCNTRVDESEWGLELPKKGPVTETSQAFIHQASGQPVRKNTLLKVIIRLDAALEL
jgi:hypothetical protein